LIEVSNALAVLTEFLPSVLAIVDEVIGQLIKPQEREPAAGDRQQAGF
jgi:hypothetical protein